MKLSRQIFNRSKAYKKCPRCGNKCLSQQDKCEECGLIFERLEQSSNKAAKLKLLHFDSDYVIYTNHYPKDISYIKLLLLTIFLGIMGAHYYYVGKFIKGILMSLSFVYLVFCTIFNAQLMQYENNSLFFLPIGIAGICWVVSLIYVIVRKFKVPVMFDPQTSEVVS